MMYWLDADKEGFLRNQRSLIQTIGRAARNEHGRVIMYADVVTTSMQQSIDETNRRRGIQMAYNEAHGIIPQTVKKSKEAIMGQTSVADSKKGKKTYYVENESQSIAADPVVAYMDKNGLEKMILKTRKAMEKAARELDFIEAAKLRDELNELKELCKAKISGQ